MKLKIILGLALVVLGLTTKIMWGTIQDLKQENARKEFNIESLFQNQDSLITHINDQAVEVKVLQLTKKEFETYRGDSEKKLKDMGVKIKNLEAVGKHNMQIKIPISGKLETNQLPEPSDEDHRVKRDSVIRCPDYIANLHIENKYLLAKATIVNDSIDMNILTSVELDQAIEIIPKHKFLFWQWGVKGVKQKIGTDNPYVKIKYSEFIKIHK